MISLLLFHLFVSATCFNAGYVFYALLNRKNKAAPAAKNGVVILFTGLMAVTLLAQMLALLFSVNFYASLLLFLLLQLVCLSQRGAYYGVLKKFAGSVAQLHPLVKLGILATWALLLLLAAGPTLMDDTESYHIQMVKWIQEWGTVPGIANLHERYGFNSSWFSSVALFSLPSQHNYYTVLNSVISVWLSLYLWLLAGPVFKTQNKTGSKKMGFTACFLLCTVLLLWPLLRGNASTVNYDFITTAMILILFLETFSKPHAAAFEAFRLEILLWPVYLFTVRILNFPLLLLSLFAFLALRKGDKRTTGAYFLAAALLVLPFLIRNVILSGYAFFPAPYFDVFGVDWKVDGPLVDDLLYYIKYYNRVNVMYQPLQQTAALHFPAWLKPWFRYLFFLR